MAKATENHLPLRIILIGALVAQLLSIAPLWEHTSTPADLFGRYSNRYAVALAVNVAANVLFAVALVFAPRLRTRLGQLPHTALWAGSGLLLSVIIGMSTLSLEAHVLTYFGLTAFSTLVVFLHPLTDDTDYFWRPVLLATLLALAVPLFLSALTASAFEPDEAHYMDYASTFMAEGQLRSAAWLEPDWKIRPGYPWGLAAYGWLVEQVGYTVYVGRVVNIMWSVVCFAGLYIAGKQLYNRDVGLLAAGLSILSLSFIPEWEFRPSQAVIMVTAWALALYLWATKRTGRTRSLGFGGLGLLVTASLNIHAAGIVFSVAYALWVVFRYAWARTQRMPDSQIYLHDALAFVGGAAIGTLLYIVANVIPVGGFGPYLEVIGQRRENSALLFPYIRWNSLLEKVLVLFGVMWLTWQRKDPDRTLLSVLGFTLLAAVFIDREGYIWHFGPLYFLVIAVFLLHAFGRGAYRAGVISGVLFIMAAVTSSTFIDWGVVRQFTTTGTVPTYFYNELKTILPDYVTPEDHIYSTHQLVWVFPQTSAPTVVTYGAENEGLMRFNVDEKREVWERVQPTVIIFIEGQMHFDPGMVEYMAANPFNICHTLEVQETTVTIYRQNCADSPI